ncbi:MAG: type II toxin-antitoxin system VapC family toxin [Chloroflexi bacterium]|nr:type II toxin-antitoxin system VapC family toxin [Chloroflexota bacterium]
MPLFYVDTSALVKRYRVEQGTDVVNLLFQDLLPEDRFYTSFLTALEMSSAFYRLVGAGQLREIEARQVLARFRRDLLDEFHVWLLTNDVVAAAEPLVETYRLRTADALHLASALAVIGLVPTTPAVMVSSDRELLRAATAAGLTVLDPTDADALNRLRQIRTAAS